MVETISQSSSFCHDAPVLPASDRLKLGEQGMVWVAVIPDDLLGLPATPGVDGGVSSLDPPEVHNQLLADIEGEVVYLASSRQSAYLLSVGRLIDVGNQAYYCHVSELHDGVGTVGGHAVVGIQGVQEAHPCGAPVLRICVEEVMLPTFTPWVRPVRKCRTHLHREEFRPRAVSFVMSL